MHTVEMVTAGRRSGRVALALIALVFFFGPNLARLAGARPVPIENRPLRDLPALSHGWEAVPGLDGWAVDHLPLRDRAVRADRAVNERLYGQVPVRDGRRAVVAGDDGWLFYGEDFTARCTPRGDLDEAWAAAARFAAMLAVTGRRSALFVPPDKSSVERDRLPSAYPHKGCAEAADTAFWHRVAEAPPAGYVDLRGPLLDLRAAQGRAYLRTDTHWTAPGAALYARALVEAAQPGVAAPADFVPTGTAERRTDLPALLATPGTERVTTVAAHRPGVRVQRVHDPAGGAHHVRSRATAPAGTTLVAARTVVIGDSFTESALDLVQPWFADLTFVHLGDVPTPYLAELLTGAGVVVFEAVQRTFATGRLAVLVPATLDVLERELSAPGGQSPR